jgi:hypothetical protein
MGGSPEPLEPTASKKKAKAATPSYGIIDSQSTKIQHASEERGIDAWLGGFRRLAKDVEIVTATAENMICIALLKITLDKCI